MSEENATPRTTPESEKLIVILGTDAGEEATLVERLRAILDADAGIRRIRLDTPIDSDDAASTGTRIGGLVEAWGERSALGRLAEALRTVRSPGAYFVEAWQEKGADVVPEDRESQKAVGILVRHWDLAPGDIRRGWDEHVPLALRIHRGMTSYTRNWVVDPLPHSADFFGFAMLRFASARSLEEEYFIHPEEESRAAIIADVARFVGLAIRLTVRERLIER